MRNRTSRGNTLDRVARLTGLLIAFSGASMPAFPAFAQTASVARPATAFLASIGFNTHMGTPASPNGTSYDNVAVIANELRYLGVTHIRDSLRIGASIGNLVTLQATAGATADLVWDDYGTTVPPATLAQAVANIATHPAVVEMFEGANEPDWFGSHFGNLSGAASVVAIQHALFSAVRSTPAFDAIPVACPALSYSGPGGLGDQLGDLAPVCDVSTSHDYVENTALGAMLPFAYIGTWTRDALSWAPGRVSAITEGGWPALPTSADGVDNTTQAKLLLDYVFDSYAEGVVRTYLYQLADEGPDPSNSSDEVHYGVFDWQGNAKPAAVALHNLAAVLSGGRAKSGHLAFAVAGLPANGHQLLLRQHAGLFDLVLWQEGTLWNATSHSAVTLAPRTVELTLARNATIGVLDPLNGATPERKVSNTRALPISVPDHPIIVRIQED